MADDPVVAKADRDRPLATDGPAPVCSASPTWRHPRPLPPSWLPEQQTKRRGRQGARGARMAAPSPASMALGCGQAGPGAGHGGTALPQLDGGPSLARLSAGG